MGSLEKRPRLAWSRFGLNAAKAMLRWSGTAVCITSLVLQMILVPFAHFWFLPSLRLRKAGLQVLCREHGWQQYVTLLCVCNLW